MSENKITPVTQGAVQPLQTGITQNFNAAVDTAIGHADTVQNNIFINNGFFANPGIKTIGLPSKITTDYYNLFVVNADAFEQCGFYIPKAQALEDTDPAIKSQCCMMDEKVKEFICSCPSIVAVQNARRGCPDASQMVKYCFVSDIRVEESAIHFLFVSLQEIYQCRMLEYANELCIGKASAFNEFDRPHWAIKHADLFAVFAKKGTPLTTFSNQPQHI